MPPNCYCPPQTASSKQTVVLLNRYIKDRLSVLEDICRWSKYMKALAAVPRETVYLKKVRAHQQFHFCRLQKDFHSLNCLIVQAVLNEEKSI